MQSGDFFAFCTSLKRPELKAIGQLSWVRHMGKGEVLYHAGEAGNALYIVNRGSLEVVPPKTSGSSQTMILSRGDVVGDVEAFSESPRTRLVRAHEDETSLQCFPRANFGELLKMVPAFFQYLCEHMAGRLMQAADMPLYQSHGLELSGRMSTFDLTTIHQTVVNSGQTGELQIKDEHMETIGAFFFEAGRLSAGQFQHLTGEEAFWQLFLIETLSGTFSFSAAEKPLTDSVQSARIDSSGCDRLIVALQYRDEFNALKAQMSYLSTKLKVAGTSLNWNGERPPELAPLAQKVWDIVAKRPATVAEVYRQCSACEYRVYHVVHELFQSYQLVPENQSLPRPLPSSQVSLRPPETGLSQTQVLLPENHAGTNI